MHGTLKFWLFFVRSDEYFVSQHCSDSRARFRSLSIFNQYFYSQLLQQYNNTTYNSPTLRLDFCTCQCVSYAHIAEILYTNLHHIGFLKSWSGEMLGLPHTPDTLVTVQSSIKRRWSHSRAMMLHFL